MTDKDIGIYLKQFIRLKEDGTLPSGTTLHDFVELHKMAYLNDIAEYLYRISEKHGIDC